MYITAVPTGPITCSNICLMNGPVCWNVVFSSSAKFGIVAEKLAKTSQVLWPGTV